jgi:hypothetical protein
MQSILCQGLLTSIFRLQHLADHSQAPCPFAQDAREPSMDWARVLRPSERLRAVKSSPWGDSLVNAGGEDKGSKRSSDFRY